MSMDVVGTSILKRKEQLQNAINGKRCTFTKGVSLAEALAEARDDCTLKYLNGAAPVIYGVPIFLEANQS